MAYVQDARKETDHDFADIEIGSPWSCGLETSGFALGCPRHQIDLSSETDDRKKAPLFEELLH